VLFPFLANQKSARNNEETLQPEQDVLEKAEAETETQRGGLKNVPETHSGIKFKALKLMDIYKYL